ncbi:MAG TPA: DUF4388 domain-containing protein [Herpetosiphonaceae bacterium]
MALEGNLREFSIPDLIQLVDLSKKTGGIHIQAQRAGEDFEGWLYFRDGRIIGAQLGNLPALEAALTFFTFHDGPFRFYDNATIDQPTITSSNEMLIMEGIGRQDEWEQIEQIIPSTSIVLRLVPNPEAGSSDINLAADEWRVLTMINGKNTIAQIADRTGLGTYRACQIVAALLRNGLVEKKALNLAESLFPQLEELARSALGTNSQLLLSEAYRRAGVQPAENTATNEQVMAAIAAFEEAVLRLVGRANATQLADRMRDRARSILGAR